MNEFKPQTIMENLLFSTVKIDVTYSNGNNGRGTGFIFAYEFEPKKSAFFIITNKHVIEDAEHGDILFHVKKKNEDVAVLGKSITFGMDNFEKGWIKHQNDNIDIAAMIITQKMINTVAQHNLEVFFRSIPNSIIPTDEYSISNIDAIEEIIFIGYPKGIYDRKNLIPIIRKGITATPISIDFEGKKQFLIDASVFPGSSGSPVFICNIGSHPIKGGRGMKFGNRILFLGILSETRTYRDNIEYIQAPIVNIPNVFYQQPLNLGIVYKSNLIVDLVTKIIDDGIYKKPEVE